MSRVKEALLSKGISIEAAAAVLGIHRNSLLNKLNGTTSFSVEEAFKLKYQVLPEYDMDYLFAPADDSDESA